MAATSVQARRYYFGMLKICTHRITLSMLTSSKLPPDLQNIKQLVGLKLVNFEEAKVELGMPLLGIRSALLLIFYEVLLSGHVLM